MKNVQFVTEAASEPFRFGANAGSVTCTSLASQIRHAPWHLYPRAFERQHKFFWINKGAGRVQINGSTRGFAPNTAFFFPAGSVFGFDLTTACAGWIISIDVDAPLLHHMPRTPYMELIGAHGEQAALGAICDDINRECETHAAAASSAALCYAGLLSVWLERHTPSHVKDAPVKPTPAQRLMAQFTKLLEDRFSTDDGVAEYAKSLGVTPTHLARVCKATNGCSANTMIQNRKLLEAKHWLAASNERVAKIATQSGFTSASYFTRLFSKRLGVSPRGFRARTRKDTDTKNPILNSYLTP